MYNQNCIWHVKMFQMDYSKLEKTSSSSSDSESEESVYSGLEEEPDTSVCINRPFPRYCEILYFRGLQFSWFSKKLQVRGFVISWI